MQLLSTIVLGALIAVPLIPSQVQQIHYEQVLTSAADPLDVYLRELSKCESGGLPDLEVLDTNGKMSRGKFMFQEHTFKTYTRKYGFLENAEDKELMNFIYDPEYQWKLTKKMIQDGGVGHWQNCREKIGEPPL